MMFAREGETDPKILKQLALAALPRIIDAYPTWAEELAVRGLNATRAWGTFRLSASGLPNRAPGSRVSELMYRRYRKTRVSFEVPSAGWL